MRSLANILFALGRIPGLGFFTGIAQGMVETAGVGDSIKQAKNANKEKQEK